VIPNFWATWCQPCLKEIPELKKLAAESKVQIVGIALDKSGLKAVGPFVERHGINYAILLGDQETFQRFDGFGIPHTLVLDSSYKVFKVYRGAVTREALEKDLQAIARRT
jgi:thiol-disulfide isomerase/thioredoxin